MVKRVLSFVLALTLLLTLLPAAALAAGAGLGNFKTVQTYQTGRFSPGQRVEHAMFGPGTVLEADLDKGAHVVQFDRMETPRSISFRAKLERL